MQTITSEVEKESVKITKNSRGYNWEIKVITLSPDGHLIEDDIDRLEKLDAKLKRRFENGESDESEESD